MSKAPPTFEAAKRVAYSPKEFAELFGKSQTWGYRQIYAGKVQAITEHGRILIPAREVERVLEKAGIYNGKEKPKAAKTRVEKLSEEEKSVWQRFLLMRHQQSAALPGKSGSQAARVPTKGRSKGATRQQALRRIASAWGGKGKR